MLPASGRPNGSYGSSLLRAAFISTASRSRSWESVCSADALARADSPPAVVAWLRDEIFYARAYAPPAPRTTRSARSAESEHAVRQSTSRPCLLRAIRKGREHRLRSGDSAVHIAAIRRTRPSRERGCEDHEERAAAMRSFQTMG